MSERTLPGQNRAEDGFLYERIADDLCSRIQHGEWAVGSRIPGRQALAQEYRVGLLTIQPAIARLLAGGLLEAIDRKGTFVARAVTPEDYFDPGNAFQEEKAQVAAPRNASTLDAPSHTKPVAGIVMLGGYQPDDEPPHSPRWGHTIVQAIERNFSRLGGCTKFHIVSLGNRFELPASFLEHVSVLIIIDNYSLMEYDVFSAFSEMCGIPFVVVGFDEYALKYPSVTYDQQYAGFLAGEHLIQCGYRTLVYFAPFSAPWVDERLKGIRTALKRYRLGPETLTIYPAAPLCDEAEYYTTGYADFEFYFHRQPEAPQPSIFDFGDGSFGQGMHAFLHADAPCGIIAPNDSLAYSVIRFAQQHHRTAGLDYGIVGFDDGWLTRQYGLTTLRPPLDAMGSTAARLAIELLGDGEVSSRVSERSHLIVRTSTRMLTSSGLPVGR